MQGLNGTFDTGLRAFARGYSRWGTLCGVLAVLVFATGCPITQGARCTEDATCDDGAYCNGAETCGDNGRCADGTAPCAEGETCNEDEDRCDVCAEDADCDDGDLCTDDACVTGQCENVAADCDDGIACTDDSCDAADGMCVNESNCAEDEVCNETTGACDSACTIAADCDDGDACTDDACVMITVPGGANVTACANSPVTCEDDGDLCTTEACNADTGACESTAVECPAGQVCDGDTGTCVEMPCTEDADCDDGAFCNGVETCDTDAGTCTAGTDPCTTGQTCNEDTDTCADVTGDILVLTLGTDTLTGTDNADVFDGQREVSGGVFFQTLNNADQLNGGNGNDTLSAQLQAAGTTTPSALTSIEILNLEVSTNNAETINAVNADSLTTINVSSGSNALTVTNVQTAPSGFGMSNNTQNFTVTCANTALSGSSDATTLSLSSNTAGTFTFGPTTGTNGYETFTIASNGGAANTLTAFAQNGGTTLTTVNVTGTQDFTLTGALPTQATTVDGSAASGDLTLTLGAATGATTFNGGSGDDTLTAIAAAQNYTINGGAGDDKIDVSANYTTSDILDGGEGTADTLILAVSEADPATSQTNATGFEILSIDDDASNDEVDASVFGVNIVEFTTDTPGTVGALTVSGMTSGGTIRLGTAVDAFGNTNAADVNLSDAAGSGDTFSLDINNTTGAGALAVDVSGVEDLTIDTVGSDQANTLDITDAQLQTVTCLIGSGNLDLDGTALSSVAATVDASGSSSTGGLLVVLNGAAINGGTITGTANADTLGGSSQADEINGGAGADTIDGNDGDDSMSGGAGADTFQFTAGDNSAAPSGTVFDEITDFETDSDIFDESVGALVIVSGSSAAAGTAAISAEGIATFDASDDTLAERVTAAEAGINASGVAAVRQFCVFEHGGNSYVFVSDGTDGVGANDVMFKLTGITGLTDTTLSGGNLTIK